MRIFFRHSTTRAGLSNAGSLADKNLENSLLEAIARGSQEAFGVLFDRTAGVVGADLTTRLRDPEQRAAILAASYLEVWWLAGCRSGVEPDVTQWVRRILDRRITMRARPRRGVSTASRGPATRNSNSRLCWNGRSTASGRSERVPRFLRRFDNRWPGNGQEIAPDPGGCPSPASRWERS
ncbi:sigma-70 family RNA polymerase sigma factor [Couchioplanes caeruleus]|uniref:hypothetical protein n=1 Tax=Couchioplanes caeruleus TaxID=56438 RepID=UPI000ABA5EDA|nr:hypothetical protein [Couchioplanes caeruleus]